MPRQQQHAVRVRQRSYSEELVLKENRPRPSRCWTCFTRNRFVGYVMVLLVLRGMWIMFETFILPSAPILRKVGVCELSSLLDYVMAFYAVGIYAIVAFIFIAFFVRRTTQLLVWCIVCAEFLVLNEVILKHWIAQPRPSGSCLTGPGMPSGHAAGSSTLFCVVIFEKCLLSSSSLPTRLSWFISASVAFVPVPFSRLYFGVHSVAQVAVGLCVGLTIALLHMLFSFTCLSDCAHGWTKFRPLSWLEVEHNYAHSLSDLQDSPLWCCIACCLGCCANSSLMDADVVEEVREELEDNPGKCPTPLTVV